MYCDQTFGNNRKIEVSGHRLIFIDVWDTVKNDEKQLVSTLLSPEDATKFAMDILWKVRNLEAR